MEGGGEGGRTVDDVKAKTKISGIDGFPYLNAVAVEEKLLMTWKPDRQLNFILIINKFDVIGHVPQFMSSWFTKGTFDLPYSGIGIHEIEVRNPLFLRTFTLRLSNTC